MQETKPQVNRDEDIKHTEKQYKKSKKSSIIGICFTVIVLVATLATIFTFNDIGAVMTEIGNAKGYDLLYAFLLLIAYVVLYPFGTRILTKSKKLNSKFFDDYFIGASEHFFNGITPYQTGAQPFQIYSYAKANVRVSDATAIILVNFLALLVSSNVFVCVSLIYAKDFFSPFLANGTLFIPILGIFFNFLVLLLFIFVATCKWFRDLLKRCLRGLCKIKFLNKLLSKSIPAFEEYCDNAQIACKQAVCDIKAFIPLVLFKLLCLFIYYSIPFFILRALGVSDKSFEYMLLATGFIVNSVVWIPTPGTSGGIEGAFMIVLGLGTTAATASLLWRGFTYYILMIISALEYFIYSAVCKIKRNKRKTL